jgi:hypothetical protein
VADVVTCVAESVSIVAAAAIVAILLPSSWVRAGGTALRIPGRLAAGVARPVAAFVALPIATTVAGAQLLRIALSRVMLAATAGALAVRATLTLPARARAILSCVSAVVLAVWVSIGHGLPPSRLGLPFSAA